MSVGIGAVGRRTVKIEVVKVCPVALSNAKSLAIFVF